MYPLRYFSQGYRFYTPFLEFEEMECERYANEGEVAHMMKEKEKTKKKKYVDEAS